jgi:hypothetical protein
LMVVVADCIGLEQQKQQSLCCQAIHPCR